MVIEVSIRSSSLTLLVHHSRGLFISKFFSFIIFFGSYFR